MNSPREEGMPAQSGKKDKAIALAVLTAIALLLEPQNPKDSVGTSGLKLRATPTTEAGDLVKKNIADLPPHLQELAAFGQSGGY